jgi:hypothetical protein
MGCITHLRPTALALALLAGTGSSQAAPPTQAELLRLLEQLSVRVDSLEKRNAELEARLANPGASAPGLASRVDKLEAASRDLEQSLASERISDQEPEIASRLKYVESQIHSVAQQARTASALEGISVEGAVVAVVQGVNDDARGDGKRETTANWRGDLGITLPGGDIGGGTGTFFAQVRMGQAEGPTDLHPSFTGTLNTASFQQAEVPADNTNAIIAQAWYQLDTPLGDGADSGRNLQVTVGKQDPFVFFDQNAIADNEVEKFINNVFVHNPLLDSGGAIGADAYGFTPGLRVAYSDESNGALPWSASAAIYGTRDGSTFGRSFTKPLYIGQLEVGQRLFGGLDGSYRLYAWHNGRYDGYDGSVGKNMGVGLSVDQRVSEGLTLFGRYGHTLSGKVAFNRAITLGGEFKGDPWGRGEDSIGLAWGWLRSARDFRRDSAMLADFGYRASGAEQVAELYYRYVLNDYLSLTPDLQFVRRAGADPDADNIYAFGVRALYAF